ncbi:MAG: ATP-binding cassette domain-containing protein [Planctomycetaceae bacterium]|nr:ATP-binding cassette domain-containing protein [Planctomycetaceae bacterium]
MTITLTNRPATRMTSDAPALRLRGLTKTYPGAGGELSILRGVNLDLHRGDAIAVIGPSGSGKSTLLYTIGVLDAPTAGEITVLGEAPHQLSLKDQAAFRNRHVGFVFQDHHLLPQCTVLENVLVRRSPRRQPPKTRSIAPAGCWTASASRRD